MSVIFLLVLVSALTNSILPNEHLQSERAPRKYAPARSITKTDFPPGTLCSMDADCAGYPFAYCDRVCRCIDGALNAGSSCISSELETSGTCPPGQTYIHEAGVCMTAQSPGEPCQYSQQCASAEPGAFCLRLTCECAYGMVPSSNGCTFVSEECHERGLVFIPEIGECREVLSPGSRGCSHNLQCSQAFSEATCVLQTCTCPSSLPEAIEGTCGRLCAAGQIYSAVAGQCLPTVQPGDQCLYTSQCHAVHHGMICERNICRCPNGLVFTGSICARLCPAGYMVNDKSVCTLGCEDNQVEVHGICLNRTVPGQSCRVNAQCTGGSTCQNEQCTCPKGMAPRGNTCVFVEAPPLASCRNGELCTKASTCANSTCICTAGRQLINGHCVPQMTVDVGGVCIRPGAMCQGGSVCVAGICTCPPNTIPSQNRCAEHKTAKPGEPCTRMEHCVDDSYCNPESRSCECLKETKMVIGTQCVERLRSHPGYPCSNGEICIGGSFCLDSRCSCPENMMEVNKQCLQRPTVHPNDGCGNGEICGGGSNCDRLQKKCTCKRNEQIINQQCAANAVVPPGRLCPSGVTGCSGGSHCIGNHCECPHRTFLSNGKCVPRRGAPPGAVCTSTDICLGGSKCYNAVCQCTSGTVLRDGRCEKKKKVPPGEPCTTVDECMGNSTCNGQVCDCPPGMVIRSGRCQQRFIVRPGYLCGVDDICVGQSICTKGVCQCKPGQHVVDSICVRSRQVMIGGHCSLADACYGGSLCKEGVCVCPEGTIVVSHHCKEIVKALPGSSCSNNELCQGGSVCDSASNTCRCLTGFELRQSKCIRIGKRKVSSASQIRPIELLPTASTRQPRGRYQSVKTTISTPSAFISTITTFTEMRPLTQSLRNSTTAIPFSMIMSTTQPESTYQISVETAPTVLPWLKLVKPGHACDSKSYCTNCSICVAGYCVCPEGLHPVDGRCTSPVDARRCLASNQCPSGAKCVDGECQCSQGLALSRFGFCIPVTYVDPGMSCSSGETCRGGSECRSGMCVCPSGLHIRNNHCEAPVREKRKISHIPLGSKDEEFLSSMKTIEDRLFNTLTVPTAISGQSASLGEQCSPEIRCATIESHCFKGRCRCNSEYVQAGNSCIHRGKIDGEFVQPEGDCRIRSFCEGGASCMNGICRCSPGFFSEGNVCIPVRARSLDSCRKGVHCTEGSLCTGGECLFLTNVADGTSASQTADVVARLSCGTNPSICTGGSYCIRGICTCPVGTRIIDGFCVPSTENQFTYAPPGSICVEGEVLCTGNSICANGYCVCPGGERIQNEMCTPVDSQADPGQMCEPGVTVCTGNSQCDRGVCRCPVGHTSLNGQCARIVKQLSVHVSKQCIPPCGVNSVCIVGKCQCVKGFILNEGMCIPQSQSSCPPNACISEKCLYTYNPSSSGALCFSPLLHSPFFGAPGQQCDLRRGALLCRGKALCVKNQCVCPMNLVLSRNECVDFAGDSYPGQSCSAPGTVCRGGSSCSGGICICGFGLAINNLQCVPPVGNINPRPVIFTFAPGPFRPLTTLPPLILLRPGAACDPTCELRQCNQRCGGGSVCVGGVCICPAGMYDYLGVCTPLSAEAVTGTITTTPLRFARPGDPCDVNIRCTGGSACIVGTCTCNPGYVPSLDRSSCVLVPSAMSSRRSFADKICTHDEECVPPSKCFHEKCICPDNHLQVDGHCHDNAALPYPGSQCVDKCAHGATCVSGYCICSHDLTTNASGYCVPHSSSKATFTLPGAPCISKANACHGNSECVHGFCLCPNSFINNGAGVCKHQSSSMPLSDPKSANRIGDSCLFHGDCTSIPMSACINHHCNCIKGYRHISGFCELDRKDAAISCKSYSECDPPRICGLSHTCECPFTMLEDSNGVCRYRIVDAPIGSYCNETTTCRSPSTCASHICTCPAGFITKNSACVPELTGVN